MKGERSISLKDAKVKTTSSDLVLISDPQSQAAEAYRALRVNIQFASPDHPLRTILATSAGPDDGKSTTLANLAAALAETGAPTLLVDADLRRPSLHTIFGLPNDSGLTSLMLAGAAAPTAEALPIQQTSVPNLRLLPSGPLPPNPAELLASRRMADLLALLAEQATYVLFDTPPVLAVADATVLASRVDGVLLVVRAGKTRRDLALKARKTLEQVKANLIGAVLTDAPMDNAAYGYYGKK
jgi:non-specific protein-tyrosine kinase